jgi:hypothetical protein
MDATSATVTIAEQATFAHLDKTDAGRVAIGGPPAAAAQGVTFEYGHPSRTKRGGSMARNLHRRSGLTRIAGIPGAAEHPAVVAGAAFVLGLAAGLFVREAVRQLYDRTRGGLWHREYERTVTYDDNLPESLGRREPAPYPGQPRYGGTGAIGVSPAAAVPGRPDEANR